MYQIVIVEDEDDPMVASIKRRYTENIQDFCRGSCGASRCVAMWPISRKRKS